MSSAKDLDFMSDLNSAIREQVHRGARALMYTCLAAVLWTLAWAWSAELDEVAHGIGKIVPEDQVQVVGNFEGGVVSSIDVRSGDLVKPGQLLLKIDNKKSEASLDESEVRMSDLKIRQARLKAESFNTTVMSLPPELERAHPEMAATERELLRSNLEQRDNLVALTRAQIEQRKLEIEETKSRLKLQETGIGLLAKEAAVYEELYKQRRVSDIEHFRAQRELVALYERRDAARDSIPRLQMSLVELERKIDDIRFAHAAKVSKELSDVTLEISQLHKMRMGLKDQIDRTRVTSPIQGYVKQLFVNTVGGVVKPGMDLVEIVPSGDRLLCEVKVNPVDIAFIHVGQPAKVKVSAYDSAIYGSFPATVERVGADSYTDPRTHQTYFLAWIRTEKNYLGTREKPLPVIPGMTVNADIVTGKKTVLQYLMKPILKAKQNALTER